MSNRSKWPYLLILGLVPVVSGLFLGGNLFSQASSTSDNHKLDYEVCSTTGCNKGCLGNIEYWDVVRYVEREVVKEIVIEKPVEVIKEVVVEKPVEVIKEVVVEKPAGLREFASLEELKTWLDNDKTDGLHLIFGSEGGLRVSPSFQDCDDYASALQKAAEKDGYQLSIQIDTVKRHALNSAFIGNDVYFIEPQTDEVWLECCRD